MQAIHAGSRFGRGRPPASVTANVMPIPSGCSIKVRGGGAEWHLSWTGFDLDDCFDLFSITVKQEGAEERYELGGCVVASLRGVARFFDSQPADDDVGGGFRNPDERYFELHRRGGQYRLVLKFTGLGWEKEFCLNGAEIVLDRKFLDAYDGRQA